MMEQVLCVCVGNISRSPMMQAVLQLQLGAGFLVESGGMSEALAGRPADARSVMCMSERGVDLSGHISRWVGSLDLEQYRWIVCVGQQEADRLRSEFRVASATIVVANERGGGIPDPYDLGLAGYRDCLALLDRTMPGVALQIRGIEPAR